LRQLMFSNTQLTNLVLSENHNDLIHLLITSSQFTAEALDVLFHALPFYDESSLGSTSFKGYIHIGDNPGTDSCNASIAEEKGWIVDTHYIPK